MAWKVFSFPSRVKSSRAGLYVIGIPLGYGKFHLQRRNLGEFGYNGCRGSVSTHTDLAQTDDTVERSTQLSLCDVRFYQVNVGIQGGQLGLYLFVGFFTDRIPFQQGVLAKHAVFCQL